ncbi:YbaB/EbfC family nucleoid-associated protein [Actinomadura sp. SCN-SB]|uniref:YbaB/EbfC family nucleoid-associated protein n=1 Tax=Actinomadura sp. SCN-SB TaxID=3373092 RepID=UPI00375367E9
MRAEWQAHIDELLAEYKRRQAGLKQLQERLAAIEAEGESEDGTVKVKVDRQGRLTSVEFDPRGLRRLGSEELAEAVMEASGKAVGEVSAQMKQAMEGLVPEGAAEEGFDLTKLVREPPRDFDAVRERYGLLDR